MVDTAPFPEPLFGEICELGDSGRPYKVFDVNHVSRRGSRPFLVKVSVVSSNYD